MNKADLIAKIQEKTGLNKKESKLALEAIVDSMTEAFIAEEKVQLVGFGTFSTRERAARQGRNPRNPEEVIQIPASKTVVFKPGKPLKDKING